MLDPDSHLDRFRIAQNAGNPSALDHVLAELRAGRKHSHGIWFVLPQLAGLGRSATAQRYGIADLDEARADLDDPMLRQRLEPGAADGQRTRCRQDNQQPHLV